MQRSLVSEEEVKRDMSNPNTHVLKCEPMHKFEPWSLERIKKCVDLVRLRMAGDRAELTAEQDKEMIEFCRFHPAILKLATSSKKDDAIALDRLLSMYKDVKAGKVTKEEMGKRLVRSLVDGESPDGGASSRAP